MTLAMKNAEQYRDFVKDFLQPVRSLVKPVSEGLFAGALDISKVPSASVRFKFRLSVPLGSGLRGITGIGTRSVHGQKLLSHC